MAIQELPVGLKEYYKTLKEKIEKDLNTALVEKDKAEEKVIEYHKELEPLRKEIFNTYKIDINGYSEFANNRYIHGMFHMTCNKLMNMYDISKDEHKNLFLLCKLDSCQRQINKYEKDIHKYETILKLKFKDYREIIKSFYNTVQEKLILEGAGYVFEGRLGWICINRSKLNNPKALLDYSATKKRKQELIEQGVKLYNRTEAEWCEKNGIEYKGADWRVFANQEYTYELAYCGCTLKDGFQYELDKYDFRGKSCRGKTNDQLREECNNDINKICKLDVDLKTKLSICIKADKTLYSKFIRNENQTSIKAGKVNRKD